MQRIGSINSHPILADFINAMCGLFSCYELLRVNSLGEQSVVQREPDLSLHGAIDDASEGGDARPIGYSIDICKAIVEEVARTLDREELKVDFVEVTAESRLQAVVEGTLDLECGSTTNNLERRRL